MSKRRNTSKKVRKHCYTVSGIVATVVSLIGSLGVTVRNLSTKEAVAKYGKSMTSLLVNI